MVIISFQIAKWPDFGLVWHTIGNNSIPSIAIVDILGCSNILLGSTGRGSSLSTFAYSQAHGVHDKREKQFFHGNLDRMMPYSESKSYDLFFPMCLHSAHSYSLKSIGGTPMFQSEKKHTLQRLDES